VAGSRYLLINKDGEPRDPGAFAVANPVWHVGDTFEPVKGRRFRIVAMTEPPESIADDFAGMWVVEPDGEALTKP
jgi:hypothetical protein